MKKSIYIVLTILLTYGNSFGRSINILNTLGVHSTEKTLNVCSHSDVHNSDNFMIKEVASENYFCKTPSVKCVEYTYLMNSESKGHANCAKIYFLYKEIKTIDNWSKFKISNSFLEKTNSKTFAESTSVYAPSAKIIFNRLESTNIEEYYSLQIDPTYYRGFGIRIRI